MTSKELIRVLSTFKLVASTDAVKRDLELTCTACNEHLCDAEDDDTLGSLVNMATRHARSCPKR